MLKVGRWITKSPAMARGIHQDRKEGRLEDWRWWGKGFEFYIEFLHPQVPPVAAWHGWTTLENCSPVCWTTINSPKWIDVTDWFRLCGLSFPNHFFWSQWIKMAGNRNFGGYQVATGAKSNTIANLKNLILFLYFKGFFCCGGLQPAWLAFYGKRHSHIPAYRLTVWNYAIF